MKQKAIVIGAGIAGLAAARALSSAGMQVTVIEKSQEASGASIRNFGMLWPIGQPDGPLYQRAVRSRSIWKEMAGTAGFQLDECGSLHLAYRPDEWVVLQELHAVFRQGGRPVKLLAPSDILSRYNGVNPAGLLGGLFSATEMIVDPREAMALLPGFLAANYGVKFLWNTAVTSVTSHQVVTFAGKMDADVIIICSGADFESLYPQKFATLPFTKCKLQMMRMAPVDSAFRIGTALCGGLSLAHYDSFKAAPSLPLLKKRFAASFPDQLKAGIHVMVCQNARGELTVGDSHEYGLHFSPFDETRINDMVLDYLRSFARCEHWYLVQSWHGIYPKLTDGNTGLFLEAESAVYLLNGMGGAGMTLSFGYAEEMVASIC